jgi:hypothetical protein
MQISLNEIEVTLGLVNEIADQYCLQYIGSDDPKRYVDHLIATCKSYLQAKIQLLELEVHKDDDESPVLGAFILLEDGSVDICYVQGLNPCWKRFVTCKEVFHLVINKVEYQNMDLVGLVEEVTIKFPDSAALPGSSPVKSEVLAQFAAMEFLFPFKQRVWELNGPNKNNYGNIAEKYKVPLQYVEVYLSPAYMEPLSKISRT